MQEIGTFAGLHHSTVSRMIKIGDGDSRDARALTSQMRRETNMYDGFALTMCTLW